MTTDLKGRETALNALNFKVPSISLVNTLEAAINQSLAFPKAGGRVAADSAKRLIGCFPNGKPADPQTYLAAIVAVMAEYPREIVEQVCDPTRGVVRGLKFLPTVAELVDALESAMAPHRRDWAREADRKERERQCELDAKALPDEAAERRIAAGLKKLSDELAASPDPLAPKRQGSEAAAEPVSSHGSRVLADLAKRKAEKLPLINIAQEAPE